MKNTVSRSCLPAIILCLVLLLTIGIPAAAMPADQVSAVRDLKGTWAIETVVSHWVPPSGDTGIDGRYLSYAMDRSGKPHIAYYDNELVQVIYLTRENGEWVRDTVGYTPGTSSTSLALSADGNPSIVFGDIDAGRLIYSEKAGTLWKTTTVDTGTGIGAFSSLAIDDRGNPHISYTDGQTISSLKYATRNGVHWTITKLDNGYWGRIAGNTGYDSSLRLNSRGLPMIAYRDGNTFGSLMVIENNGSWREPVTVDTGWGGTPDAGDTFGDTGYYPSLAFDPDDNPVVAYYDRKDRFLMVATRNDEEKWKTMFWDAPGNFYGGRDKGLYPSLAIGSRGDQYLSYYDATGHELRFQHIRADGVDFSTVDRDGDVGKYSVLVLDPAENPSIAYYDATRQAIRLATWSGASDPPPEDP